MGTSVTVTSAGQTGARAITAADMDVASDSKANFRKAIVRDRIHERAHWIPL